MNQMDQVTQQNAAMVEQSTAASIGLSEETEGLAQLTDRFHVGEDVALARASSRKPPMTSKAPAVKPAGRGRAVLRAVGGAGEWSEF